MTRFRAGRRGLAEGAFSVLEVLLALAAGLTLAGVVIQGMAEATRSAERLGLLLRERQAARRTLALLGSEFGQARDWRAGSGAAAGADCALGGRAPVVALQVAGRWITYSVGTAPSRIWRGQVLMRCGPAYGLSGDLSGGAAQNRVVIDGLAPTGLQVESEGPGVLRLRLRQAFAQPSGRTLELHSSHLAVAPSAPPGP
ncbi:MAG: prepilin-type cleavage/methylation domain-containing protein [Cyanobacteriota bacterium]